MKKMSKILAFFLVLCNEVGLSVNLDHNGHAILGHNINYALGCDSACPRL